MSVYEYTTYSRPAGIRGPAGAPGGVPLYVLNAGQPGADGSCQIGVVAGDGSVAATYSGRYGIVVMGFDVIDENDDGIFEPGEHLIVKNIRVQNNGSDLPLGLLVV
jgi:hypothetical protein